MDGGLYWHAKANVLVAILRQETGEFFGLGFDIVTISGSKLREHVAHDVNPKEFHFGCGYNQTKCSALL